VLDSGFLSSAAAMAVGAGGLGVGGLAYARVLSELRLCISTTLWRRHYSIAALATPTCVGVAGQGHRT